MAPASGDDRADERLRSIAFAVAATGVLITDPSLPDNPVIDANPAFTRITGYARGEILGRNCRFLQGPGTDPAAVARIREAVAAGRDVTETLLNYRKDGTPFWNELCITPVRDASGAVTHFVGVQSDVTDRRRAAHDLRAEADRLSAVVSMQTEIAALTADPEAVMRLAVARIMDLTGAGAAGIATLKGEDAVYRVVAGTASHVAGVPFPATSCTSGLSLLTGKSYRVVDSETDPLADRDLMRAAGVRSLLTAPLWHEGKVVGSLSIGAPRPGAFGWREEHLLALVAGLIGSSLAHATALAAAQAAEARFRSLVENAPDVILVTDAEGRITFASPATKRVLGYAPESLVGTMAFDLIHPDDLPATLEVFAAILAVPGGTGGRQNRMRRADGTLIWAEGVGQNRLDDPAVAGIVINFHEVTQQVLAGQALRASEARLNEAQAIARVGSWEADLATGSIRWSDEMYRLHGFAVGDDVSNKRFLATVHPDDRERVADDAARALRETGRLEIEYRVVLPDGVVRVLCATGEVERDAGGTPIRIVGTSQDVTERTRWEANLVAARDAAEEASRLKSAFLSTMSHELRTPLTAIMGYSNLLLEGIGGKLTPQQAEDVGLIASGADRLLALINDVLDLSRIGAGMLVLSPKPLNLARVAEAVAADLAPQAAAKGLAVDLDVPPGLTIHADPMRLHQVLLNLVGNAVKFTETGRIAISARPVGERVEIAVADTGIGIDPKALPHVFDEFRQADESTTRRFGGSGLGLAISRRLVELHGGTIDAESTPGIGSTFTVTLPVGTADARRPGIDDADAARADAPALAAPNGRAPVAGQEGGAPSASAAPGRTSPLS